ncbi:MAG: branched-chain amino acid ABC transporter permease [Thermoleophilia bacterium]|nr:branched-chain amino acid ABC transporter permease [Thermoleophilia bacterium]
MENFVFGIVTGSIILLGAVGFSMTLNSDHFVNVAHGQMLLLGAYLALYFSKLTGNFALGAIISVIMTGALGMLFYAAVYRPIKTKGPLILLFTSVGLSYFIWGIVGAVSGSQTQAYEIPAVRAIRVFGTPLITSYELTIILVAVIFAVSLHLFFAKTRQGKLIRAVADNHDLARIRGINPLRRALYVWFIASGMAAMSGIFLGMISSIDLELGWKQILIILSATVLGGLGSTYGVMFAAILIGLSMELGILILPSHYRSAIAFAIIIIVLLVRPEGLKSVVPALRGRPVESDMESL